MQDSVIGATAFLARVANADEARIALDCGADRLGLTDARGALSKGDVFAIVEAIAGRCPVSAAPDIFGTERDPEQAVQELAECGVDLVELDADTRSEAIFAALRRHHPTINSVVVVRAAAHNMIGLGRYSEARFGAAFLKPARLEGARLIDVPGIEGLAQFVHAAQRRGLSAWLGGALEAPDVPRMLALQPDVLAFRTSLCRDSRRDLPLDAARVREMRQLIPRGGVASPAEHVSPAHTEENFRDRVFVRDFIVEAGIGAYRYEHRGPQRMRFNVEADLLPIPDTVADMRDVFSYDVIVDAIRLATRRHALLVERVALDVAEATLRDARVRRVRVRVEKLDIIDGAVGIELLREAPGGA